MDINAIKANNNVFVEAMCNKDAGIQKTAGDKVEGMLRETVREGGITRNLITPENVGVSNLHREMDSDLPVIIRDKEPNSGGAVEVAFGDSPQNYNLHKERYRLMFKRLRTNRLREDRIKLLNTDYDILKIIQDFQVLDILNEEDKKWLSGHDLICGGVPVKRNVGDTDWESTDAGAETLDAIKLKPRTANTGAYGYIQSGGSDKSGFARAFAALTQTDQKNPAVRGLVNTTTIAEYSANSDSMSLSNEQTGIIAEKGFGMDTLDGKEIMITTKSNMVASGDMYIYAPEEFIGDFCVLEDITVFNESKHHMFETFATECIGAAIKNDASVSKHKFILDGAIDVRV